MDQQITDNQALVARRLAECLLIARTQFPDVTFKMPSVLFTLKGETGGTYTFARNCLNFHNVFLNENVEHYVAETVTHEFAHYVHCTLHALSPTCKFIKHGRHFKAITRMLGGTPSTCHAYSTTNIEQPTQRRKMMACVCTKCGEKLEMGKIRYNRMVNNKAAYKHFNCGGKIAAV